MDCLEVRENNCNVWGGLPLIYLKGPLLFSGIFLGVPGGAFTTEQEEWYANT